MVGQFTIPCVAAFLTVVHFTIYKSLGLVGYLLPRIESPKTARPEKSHVPAGFSSLLGLRGSSRSNALIVLLFGSNRRLNICNVIECRAPQFLLLTLSGHSDVTSCYPQCKNRPRPKRPRHPGSGEDSSF